MSAKKPLIFVHPLSESLKKLHEVITEISEDEGIEIYDVDLPMEANQLIPSVGQSLSIFSAPKKCASILQPNRKIIQKLNSKVILLSPKSLPPKTLDKFQKIGLTEFINEPVAPKTLLYKVKLLLRSIVVSEKEEEKEDKGKGYSSTDEETVKLDEKQRLEKGVLEDANILDYNLKGKVGTDLTIDSDDSEEKKERTYKEESIEGDWKGSVDNTSLTLEEEEEQKKKDQEEDGENYLDAYLRGKSSKSLATEFEEDTDHKKKDNADAQSYYEDEVEKLRPQDISLDFEKESSKRNDEQQAQNDDKYYKGKVQDTTLDLEAKSQESEDKSETQLEEEQRKREKEMLLDLEQDSSSKGSKGDHAQDFEEDNEKKKNNEEMSLDLEADSSSTSPSSDQEEEQEKNKSKDKESLLSLEQEREKKKQEEQTLDLHSDKEEQKEENEEEQDDKYYKGKVATTLELSESEDKDTRSNSEEVEEDHSHNRLNNEKALDLEAALEDYKEDESDNLLDDEEASKNHQDTLLDLDKDSESKNKNEQDISLEFEKDKNNDQDEQASLESEEDYLKSSSHETNLKFDEEQKEKESLNQEDEGDYNQQDRGLELDLEDDGDGLKKNSAHTEHIQTNYDSRKSLRHDEQDWDIVTKKQKQDDESDSGQKAKSDIEISFKQKVDLGEQTIDYRKLKSEFDAITINRAGSNNKKSGPKYYSDEEQEQQRLKAIYGEDYKIALDEINQQAAINKEEDENITVYEPRPKGLDVAISVMNLYYNKDTNKKDIFEYITKQILLKYLGHTFFYNFNTESNSFERGHSLTSLDEYEGINYLLLEEFEHIHDGQFDNWKEMNLPTWKDETFQEETNYFFYPIYEGANKLGFAIVIFKTAIEKEVTKSIEAILETTRGIILDEYHQKGVSPSGDVKKSTQATEKKTSIIDKVFGKFFKKKAS